MRAMMDTAVAFDTLVYARKLKDAGVPDAQAEAHAEAVRDALTESVATKADIRGVKAEIANLKTEIHAMKWILGFNSAFVLAVVMRLFGLV